jgi:hypothetical protein
MFREYRKSLWLAKGNVVEIPDGDIGSKLSKQCGDKHHLVVMNPDDALWICHLGSTSSTRRVHLAIGLPPGGVKFWLHADIVKQGPKGAIAKTLVVALHKGCAKRHRKKRDVFRNKFVGFTRVGPVPPHPG